MAAKRLWVQSYRPATLEGYVFQSEQQKEQLTRLAGSGDIPHLLLTGTQGSGKTTLALILINALEVDEVDVLTVNASEQTGVDFIRDVVIPFSSSYPLGKFKIVHLQEADYLSLNAQGMLREVMESNSDTCRFVLTCNYENKIIPALLSRVQHIRFKAPDRDSVLLRAAEILIAEEVDIDPEVLDKYVSQAYPDIRKLINNLQLNTVNGKLMEPSTDVDGGDYQFQLLDLIITGNLRAIRTLISEKCSAEQLTEVYEFLYRNIEKHPHYVKNRNAYEQALVILAEGVYKHGLVAIPHLNFEATMIRLFHAIE
jgi:DNA polymerase III delta prime subunit